MNEKEIVEMLLKPYSDYMEKIDDIKEEYYKAEQLNTDLETLVYSLEKFIILESQYSPKVDKLDSELNKEIMKWQDSGRDKLITKLNKQSVERFIVKMGLDKLTKKNVNVFYDILLPIFKASLFNITVSELLNKN